MSLGSRKKSTYEALDGKTPIWVSNWKEVVMSSFNFQDNPFWRTQEEIDQLQSQYSKLKYVTKGACKLLGKCKPMDLCKELEKMVERKDTTTLEANNAKLVGQVADLRVEIAKKNEEIRKLHTQSKEGLDQIQDFIGNPGDFVNKARLFDSKVKTKR